MVRGQGFEALFQKTSIFHDWFILQKKIAE